MNHTITSIHAIRGAQARLALALALLLTICLPATAFASPAPSAAQVKTTIDQVSAYGVAQLTANGADYGDEWALMGLARAGMLPDSLKQQYLDNLAHYLKDNGNSLGDSAYSTDYERVILALTALGVDATSFNGIDLTAPLASLDFITGQGINSSIYALLALDSHNYQTPTLPAGSSDTQTTRDLLIADILGQKLSGGGWNWGFGMTDPDPDVTSMALQALAPYYHTGDAGLDSTVDAALATLGSLQDDVTAGFPGADWGWGPTPPACASTAQALTALSALGIDIEDARFVKTGGSLYDSLSSFLFNAGSGAQAFVNIVGDSEPDDMFSTYQGLYSLVAYWRELTGISCLYDMNDVTLQPYASTTGGSGGGSGGGTDGNTGNNQGGDNGGTTHGDKTDSGTGADTTLAAATMKKAALLSTNDASARTQVYLIVALLAGALLALCVLAATRQRHKGQAL